jgi:hypothetical protein
MAQRQGTPIILCFKHSESNCAKPVEYVNPDSLHHQLQIGEGFVSLIALGIPEIVKVIPYQNQADGIKKVLDAVEVLEKD